MPSASSSSATAANCNLNATSNYLPDPDEVPWENTFHARTANLSNFPTPPAIYRATYRSQSNTISRAKMGCVTNTTKSLNILRQALQRNLNEEIHEVINKYLDKFFRPAVENIKANSEGVNCVSEHHLQAVCQRILEEAKKMYFVGLVARCQSPSRSAHSMHTKTNWDSDLAAEQNSVKAHKSAVKRQRDNSASDSEPSAQTARVPGRPKKKKKHYGEMTTSSSCNGGASAPRPMPSAPSKAHVKLINPNDGVRRCGPRWDPTRLSTATKFVLGSKANKALGFALTRGRLYTKHADLFRYIGDQEDKQWLSERGLMPPAGGRAYLLIKADIEDLIATDEYRGAPGVKASDMGAGFYVPELMISKMKRLMASMRDADDSAPLGANVEPPPGGAVTDSAASSTMSSAQSDVQEALDNSTMSGADSPASSLLSSEPPLLS